MINMPLPLMIFVLGLFVGMVSYIWGSLTKKIGTTTEKVESLDKKVNSLDFLKCHECEPVTVSQVKEIVTNEFDKFRLELYRSGVMKPEARRKKPE
ncbi:hypothetical protein MASR1M36_08930 [Candidatus Cloacimonadaceae bacterium]|jgi:hypothetical protein